MVKLGDVCKKGSSNIAQKDLEGHDGNYPIYGASGYIKGVDFYQMENAYIAVVKDGAGIGRIMKLPGKSSVIGTMQYIIPNDSVDIGYLAYAMEHMNLAKYYSGATIPHIYFKDYQKELFPLPSLDEQRKIAAVLDKISGLIAKRRQQLDKLDELVKSRFIEMFGDPETNTKNWRVLPMTRICSVGSSKRIYQSEQSSSGVPFWRISDLTNLITTGIVTPELYISEERYKELKSQGQVPAPGDILITSRGTLGQCYIVKRNDRFYFQDGMISRLSGYIDGVTPLYISYLFAMPGFRKQINSMQAGSTVAYLSIAMIKRLKVMLPDIKAQQQFTFFVKQAEAIKSTISRSLEKLEMLKNALMQRYFM